jgi:adenosylmethionine-8-amino-7-oxononanoate aminotransferase
MSLLSRDQKFIWHPFTPQKNMPAPIAITSAKGSLLFDENGNQYIDAISSWWVNIHGHAHPYIAEKIYRQALKLEHIIFAGFTHQPAVDLAEKLLALLPRNFSKIFLQRRRLNINRSSDKNGVTVLVESASASNSKHQTQKRNKILAFNNAYHGDTFGAMSVSDRSVFTAAFQELLFDVIFIDTPSEENITTSKKIIEENANEIAAFIYEPLLQGAGGMKMYNPILLDELLLFIKQKNIICIADEVMTGFGRTGKNVCERIHANKARHHLP